MCVCEFVFSLVRIACANRLANSNTSAFSGEKLHHAILSVGTL